MIMKSVANEVLLIIVVKIIKGKDIHFKVWGRSSRMYVLQTEANKKDEFSCGWDLAEFLRLGILWHLMVVLLHHSMCTFPSRTRKQDTF